MLEHLAGAAGGTSSLEEDAEMRTHQSATILTVDPTFPEW
jgi:hypothetical protein